MPKLKSSGRGRRKKINRSRTKSLRKSKQKNQRSASENSSVDAQSEKSFVSETSPFKGWDQENIKESQPLDNVDDIEDKDSLFEKLLDPPLRSQFLNKNIRTYSNKKKMIQENYLLEFQDSKNREKIIQWLNDNHNLFDRLTQTQCDYVSQEQNEVPLTLDMPSVSQINNDTRMSRPDNRRMRNTHRCPQKSRAQSLDIHITKNARNGRNKRHSLAGDTPSMENYHIEEILTNEEDSVPAEKDAKLLVDLMEDEYLNKIEKEILQTYGKEHVKINKSVNGWERIRNINKTINGSNKQPKPLKITLQGSSIQKEDQLQNNKCYDYNEMENYFIEKMEKMMNKEFIDSSYCNQAITDDDYSIQNVVQIGNNLVNVLNKLICVKDKNNLSDLGPMITEIKNVFNALEIDKNVINKGPVQTIVKEKCNKLIQTDTQTNNAEMQTENLVTCQNCANNNSINYMINGKKSLCDKIVQTAVEMKNIEIQTEMVNDNNIQNCANPLIKTVQQSGPHTSGSTTPSDIFLLTEMERLISMNENNSHNLNETINEKTIVTNADYTLDRTLDDIYFDTEDALQQEVNGIKENVEQSVDVNQSVPITVESVLICTAESKNKAICGKGIKRMLATSPVNETQKFGTKRPCNKFIKDDLSVSFVSCNTLDTNGIQNENVVQLSNGSDADDYDEHLGKVMRDNISNGIPNDSLPTVNKRLQDTEDLEEKMRNVTKPKHLENLINDHQKTCDSDVIFIEAEMNMSRFEKDLKYFEPCSSISDTEKTPKVRKRLFQSQENRLNASCKFSESLFDSGHNRTVVATKCTENITDQTLTRNDSAKITKGTDPDCDSEVNKEVQDILSNKMHKINILQNVVIKSARNEDETNSGYADDDFVLSGVDVVESTPQKKFAGIVEHRCESLLDITLPPPLEFQDVEMEDENEVKSNTIADPIVIKKNTSPRRPLVVINKITSTPNSLTQASEKISLSPISMEKNRIPGPIELAQRLKFSPLTIVKTTQSQKSVRSSCIPKQKSILNYVRPSQESSQETPSPVSPMNKPCVSCSRVGRDQVMAISAMTNRKLVTYSSSFSQKVTHMIVSVNHENRIKDHTIKSVSAIAAGIWVLSFGWVQECLTKNALVPEEPFEVLDVSGVPGPRKSRLTKSTQPLLKGFKIYISPPFLTTSLTDIENIVKMLGGKVASLPEELLDKDNHICLIITEGKATQDCDTEKFETWLDALRVVTVDLEWLSRSVGQYQLQSLLPFTLCSDDLIDTLGYPPELLLNAPVSFTQSTSGTI